MPRKRRNISRKLGKLRYRKRFILVVEGNKTEPKYFSVFNVRNSVIRVKCLKKGKHDSSPSKVLSRMEKHLNEEGLKNSDEAWLVVDKDQWTDEQLSQLHQWSLKKENYGFALSNPKFEFWLLLHFENGVGVSSSKKCSKKLERYLPNYDKGIDINKISGMMIIDAIRRAKQRDIPPCEDWPRNTGSTIYKLVERILKSQNC
ncbi:MAG: RloB domain-containing protein [Rhodobacteraceae bacterium]|nr:RloB domain-containing protein [Paracoccaceae bacterium]MYF45038.1 RloB domain-containing protein [Paracoccaceae bacterium]